MFFLSHAFCFFGGDSTLSVFTIEGNAVSMNIKNWFFRKENKGMAFVLAQNSFSFI